VGEDGADILELRLCAATPELAGGRPGDGNGKIRVPGSRASVRGSEDQIEPEGVVELVEADKLPTSPVPE
jgi:hypothetical protein